MRALLAVALSFGKFQIKSKKSRAQTHTYDAQVRLRLNGRKSGSEQSHRRVFHLTDIILRKVHVNVLSMSGELICHIFRLFFLPMDLVAI